ncbi:non-ribosomal peptide synthetase [Cellulomonas sp. URHB0016]
MTNQLASGPAPQTLHAPDAAGSPLSWFQERMWVHHQRSPESTSYSLPLMLLVEGDLDVPALEQSLSLVVARHESLRTSYGETDGGVPVQRVAPAEPVHLPVVPVDRAGLLEQLERFLEHRFDLHQGHVFIARLLRLSGDRHLLLFNVHHIAADAWSLKAIFLAELQGAYAAFARAQEPDLPPLTLQYTDFARVQRTSDLTADLDYWRDELDGYEDTLELPTVRPRGRHPGATRGTFVHRYPEEFSRELERFSRRHGGTIFMSLLAGLGVTLSRYTGRDDLCIGTTASDRPDVALEPLIGFFVNIVPLRLRVDENSSVAELLEAVRSRVLGAFEHPVPFEQVLQVTDAARRGSANPLVPVVMRHQNFPEAALGTALPGDVTFRSYPGREEPDDAVLTLVAQEHVPARCEIELSYAGGGDGLEVEVVYASDLYDRASVERLLAHHQRVLEGMFAEAGRRVVDLPLLRDSDVAELVARNDRVPATEAPAWSFVERFDAQVARTPDAVACWDSGPAWSYRDLSRRASQVAHAVGARGTAPGELVAVCLPRGGELLATLLGVWKAGAAYVPLDPSYPAAYLQQILDDSSPRAVVCDARHQALLGVEDSRCVRLDDLASTEGAGPERAAGPDELAYVMYTSGSTGTPKGVRVPHGQLDNWLGALDARLPFEPGEVVAQKTPFAFAVAVKELFAGLLNGCPQVFVDDAAVRDTAAFVDALAEHRVSRLNLVPSHLAAVVEHVKDTGTRLPRAPGLHHRRRAAAAGAGPGVP